MEAAQNTQCPIVLSEQISRLFWEHVCNSACVHDNICDGAQPPLVPRLTTNKFTEVWSIFFASMKLTLSQN